jgi:hypothetical protein
MPLPGDGVARYAEGMSDAATHDPRNLIGEAYRIEGIGAADCRSIFLDWALGLPAGVAPSQAAAALLEHHAAPAGHPMTALLAEAAGSGAAAGRRRGGAKGRRRTGG